VATFCALGKAMLNFLANLFVAAVVSFGITDALYMGFVRPVEITHPFLANIAGYSILTFLFVGLFLSNLRIAASAIILIGSLAMVAGICFCLHFLK
jgi:hypothetical protein